MPVRFEVVILPAAERDYQSLYDWIALRSPEGADRWANAFLNALDRIREHPDGFSLAPEAERYGMPIRQLLFKTRRGRTYRALFLVQQERVLILHVRGSGQRLMGLGEIEGLPDP